MKKLCILGSTGSIGTQTLEIVRDNPGDFEIISLAVNTNTEALLLQIREFNPKLVCVYDEKKALELKKQINNDTKILTGMEGLIACATQSDVDTVVGAVVGMIGVRPVYEAIKAGKDIALANKETLVTAGHIIMPLVKERKVSLLPVDSEHSAIFQALNGEDPSRISKILLTASGGPFKGMTLKELENVTVEDALCHPNWSMGKKITIDSATMVNKGLEMIEAKWLFDTDIDNIQVLIQPQSIIHSMVEYVDGAVIAQLGTPDMRLPIQYALYYPDRRYLRGERLDFYSLSHIDFEKPDFDTFAGPALAIRAAKAGGSMPIVYNAANEKAVDKFLKKEISFLDITRIINDAMDRHAVIPDPDVDTIIEIGRDTFSSIQ